MAVLETDKLVTPTGVVAGGEQTMQTVGVTVDGSGNLNAAGGLKSTAGILELIETTTPAAVVGSGKLWTTTGNDLWFQDGNGDLHLVHDDSYSDIWYHGATFDVVTISTEDILTKITSFENVGDEDAHSNIVGSTVNNELVVGANGAGEYRIEFYNSTTIAGGASKEILIAPGIEWVTPVDVTGATNATPIVVTSEAHGLLNGDMIIISGATTNTGANGSFIVASKTVDAFTLIALDGSNSVGNGVYDASSGDVTHYFPGDMVSRREVSQSTVGGGAGAAEHSLAVGDKVGLYVANLDDISSLQVYQASLEARRTGN